MPQIEKSFDFRSYLKQSFHGTALGNKLENVGAVYLHRVKIESERKLTRECNYSKKLLKTIVLFFIGSLVDCSKISSARPGKE